jgi:hypothetical protein
MKGIAITMLWLCTVAACGTVNTTAVDTTDIPPQVEYVAFGLSVLCLASDRDCLRERFNVCLGQTRKQHVRESGPPNHLTVFPNGTAVAEWRLKGSNGWVRIDYDAMGQATAWTYQAPWGTLHNERAPADVLPANPR